MLNAIRANVDLIAVVVLAFVLAAGTQRPVWRTPRVMPVAVDVR